MPSATSWPDLARSVWHNQRIKGLVRDQMGQGVQCIISVQETICTDPECPGPATQVRVIMTSFQEISGVIHKAPSQVTSVDIADLLN